MGVCLSVCGRFSMYRENNSEFWFLLHFQIFNRNHLFGSVSTKGRSSLEAALALSLVHNKWLKLTFSSWWYTRWNETVSIKKFTLSLVQRVTKGLALIQKIFEKYFVRDSKQPPGCFSLQWKLKVTDTHTFTHRSMIEIKIYWMRYNVFLQIVQSQQHILKDSILIIFVFLFVCLDGKFQGLRLTNPRASDIKLSRGENVWTQPNPNMLQSLT